ncbi:RNA-binding protein [Paraburkholderia sp.]|uniref:RNA-binding protein n=2 Tax=unclassified Paraburkholderia TaxID=2615204 RepID=UPI00286ED884|nr:RNA-binding protein [Paraburkholderia sp.]
MMGELWIGNIDADVSPDEINEFLGRYGCPPFDAIQRVPGTGDRPAVVLSFDKLSPEALRMLQTRIHNIQWNHRAIVVQVMPPRRED